MRDFFRKRVEKQVEKGVENRIKNAVDKQMGSNEGDNDETDERFSDEEEQPKEERGRKFFRRLSDKFRGRSSSSSASNQSPAKKRKRSMFKSPKSNETDVEPSNSKNSASDSNFTQTETPDNSANSGNSDQESNDSDGTNRSRDGSDWQDGTTASDQSDFEEQQRKRRSKIKSDEMRLLEMRPDDAVAYNSQTKTNFTVRVRIIEAKELQGDQLNPLVRVHLANKTRTTRSIQGVSNPRWDQTLSFNVTKSIEDLAMLNCEFNVYAARLFIRDSLIGNFNINTGVVYKSKQQSVVEKCQKLKIIE